MLQGEENEEDVRSTLAENTRDLYLRWFPLGLVPTSPGFHGFFSTLFANHHPFFCVSSSSLSSYRSFFLLVLLFSFRTVSIVLSPLLVLLDQFSFARERENLGSLFHFSTMQTRVLPRSMARLIGGGSRFEESWRTQFQASTVVSVLRNIARLEVAAGADFLVIYRVIDDCSWLGNNSIQHFISILGPFQFVHVYMCIIFTLELEIAKSWLNSIGNKAYKQKRFFNFRFTVIKKLK